MDKLNQKKVIRIDENGNKKEYESVLEAANDTGILPTQVSRSFREQTTVKGFRFIYPDEPQNSKVKKTNGKDLDFLLKARKSFDRPPFFMKGKMTAGKEKRETISNISDADLDKVLNSLSKE